MWPEMSLNDYMKKPKILYWLPNKGCERIFLSMVEDPRVEQLIAQSHLTSSQGLQLKTQIYSHTSEAANMANITNIINSYRPDVFVQCDDVETMTSVIKERGIKNVFLNHGVWPHSPNNRSRVSNARWARFDLVCGATRRFRDLHEQYAHPNFKAPVVINTLTQFDVLYQKLQNQLEDRRHVIRSSKNKNATKLITLFGHHCDDRVSLHSQNAGYYRGVIELEALARKHNWLLAVKSKTPKVDEFIRKIKVQWANELREPYFKAMNGDYVLAIEPHTDPYKYFCSDVIVCSARSTIEVETALARKPLIRIYVPWGPKHEVEPQYENGTMDFEAAYVLKDWDSLETLMMNAINNSTGLNSKQDDFIKYLEIIFDGKAHIRLIDAILGIMK